MRKYKRSIEPVQPRISEGQIGNLFDQLRPVIQDSGVHPSRFQIIAEQAPEMRVPLLFRRFLIELAKEAVPAVDVCVNYDLPDAIAKAVTEGNVKYDDRFRDNGGRQCTALALSEVPVVGRGQTVNRVFQLPITAVTGSDIVYREMEIRGCDFADPLTFVRYAPHMPLRPEPDRGTGHGYSGYGYAVGTLFMHKEVLWLFKFRERYYCGDMVERCLEMAPFGATEQEFVTVGRDRLRQPRYYLGVRK